MTQIQFTNALLGLSDKLHYYALSLTSDSERADDLLQETFLKALTYREKFTQNTNFKAWIYTIMKNTFINDYRRKVKTKNTFEGSNNDFHLMFTKDKVYPAPDSFYSSKEITKSINALEDEYKVPFTMFLDGYKYKEIAEELSLPLGTVKSRIFFTRKKLEKALHEYSDN
ncbi:RNA polymerase sigma factor [Maribellus sp. CM-23]|uniref:RNA polymerase sigma factor n=1 Tax=Maribellus luteus TaxID=2305463 RepID=A0A399T5Y3_9BACT|nr:MULTISPECIES: RNA polymerase sigma factor [Maribellus]MCE4564651.1 RNA polymerase sigma factor [Maribellus sp. CM-23]RIJ50559.1 RNA polymerase sigma factor [Maribellus luteus]